MAYAREKKRGDEKSGIVFASLSGVSSRAEVEDLMGDVACVLVGEALMRHPDPRRLVAELRGAEPSSADDATRHLAKVCGIARVDDAVAACRAGADLIGIVAAPESKRAVKAVCARDIVDAVREYGERSSRWAPGTRESLGDWAAALRRDTARGRPLTVAVVQDQPLEDVLEFLETSGADAVQLHGSEDAAYAAALPVPHVRVLHAPELAEDADGAAVGAAAAALADAFEPSPSCCAVALDAVPAGGTVSGGAGVACDWRLASALADRGIPVLVAGGVDAAAVAGAAAAVSAAVVGFDASSRLETAPGVKDAAAVRAYVDAVTAAPRAA